MSVKLNASYPAPSLEQWRRASFLVRRSVIIRWCSIAVILLALVLLMRTLPMGRMLEPVRSWIDSLGMWGPFALGALYILATLLFIPGSVLTLAAGAIYGLVLGTVIVSVSSTTGAALAFLIARYIARRRVRHMVEQSPKLAAVDEAIGAQGWKIVALLRLSPAVPFNLQNYLYGVTAIRFWPCVLVSWATMLPGTFMYVYLGSIGGTAAAGHATSPAEWALRAVGLLATVVATILIAHLARSAIRQRIDVDAVDKDVDDRPVDDEIPNDDEINEPYDARQMWGALATAALALTMITLAGWSLIRPDEFQTTIVRILGAPPAVTSIEAYEPKPDGPVVDHSRLDALLRKHVDDDGWVDYEGMQTDAAQLDSYLAELAEVPFELLGRNQKLALLINAYNAFTIRLILDHQPLDSIRDISANQRWDARRWQVGSHVWSLSQIEHEQIRPNFVEPRVHFALVCAAIGCPPLRNEAYSAGRLEEQLADQVNYVHSHPRWLRFETSSDEVWLTKLYDWYGSDFTQQAPSVLDFVGRSVAPLRQVLDASKHPEIRWLEYDWRLNSIRNKDRE